MWLAGDSILAVFLRHVEARSAMDCQISSVVQDERVLLSVRSATSSIHGKQDIPPRIHNCPAETGDSNLERSRPAEILGTKRRFDASFGAPELVEVSEGRRLICGLERQLSWPELCLRFRNFSADRKRYAGHFERAHGRPVSTPKDDNGPSPSPVAMDWNQSASSESNDQEDQASNTHSDNYGSAEDRDLQEVIAAKQSCAHYKRKCVLRADCCGEFVPCRMCHDDVSNHGAMDRYATKEIMCTECLTKQPVAEKCINPDCAVSFGEYFCAICKFYGSSKNGIFHCDKCRMCRSGRAEDCFHCDKCNSCIKMKSKSSHTCHQGALHGNCPCCLEFLHSSTSPVVFLRCGHAMHASCFDEYTKLKYTCPLCMKSLTDMTTYFQNIEKFLHCQTLPKEYQNMYTRIYCNDCGRESDVNYHPRKLFRCAAGSDCRSFNTRVKKQYAV